MVEDLLLRYGTLESYLYSTLMACDAGLLAERIRRHVLAQPTCWD